MEAINIFQVSQYGDNFICHAKCPKCSESAFFPYGQDFCCVKDAKEKAYSFKKSHFRLVVGSMRKLRMGKRLVQSMYKDQEGKCAYCFKDIGVDYHVEHIIPVSVGGTNNRVNLCLSCPRCNLIAGSMYFASYEAKRDYILDRRRIAG